jgi:alpha-galactosidase
MFKLTFIGAGSTVFAKNIIGDILISPDLEGYEIALYDIDLTRLEESRVMLETIRRTHNRQATIKAYHDRKDALSGADFIVNAIQVGGYRPGTVRDFEIPKAFGLRQTIGDTLGIGGIFRALRTIPVLEEIAKDMQEVCPDALFLNYTNPMAILTGYLDRVLGVRVIGLCHSVQACVPELFRMLGMESSIEGHTSKIFGINHQAWLTEIRDRNGRDLYPMIKERATDPSYDRRRDLVRLDMMRHFGYYVTESSEHTAEYVPYYIKTAYPELVTRFNIPLDEYPRRCEAQIENWNTIRDSLVSENRLDHKMSDEFALPIIRATMTGTPVVIHGNVTNKGFITNLPDDACVEVPCTIDKRGVHPHRMGDLPLQCASLNLTNINVQRLVIEGARTRDKDLIRQAVYLDPHTASELPLDTMRAMTDALFDAHSDSIPPYKETP